MKVNKCVYVLVNKKGDYYFVQNLNLDQTFKNIGQSIMQFMIKFPCHSFVKIPQLSWEIFYSKTFPRSSWPLTLKVKVKFDLTNGYLKCSFLFVLKIWQSGSMWIRACGGRPKILLTWIIHNYILFRSVPCKS